MRFELFKAQMRMLKQYRESKEDLEKEIDDIVYQYCGVKGLSYDTEKISQSYITDEKLILMSEKLIEPQRQLDFTIIAINQLTPIVNENLNKLPKEIKEASELIFWKNYTYQEVGKKLGYSEGGLWKVIKREVEKI